MYFRVPLILKGALLRSYVRIGRGAIIKVDRPGTVTKNHIELITYYYFFERTLKNKK